MKPKLIKIPLCVRVTAMIAGLLMISSGSSGADGTSEASAIDKGDGQEISVLRFEPEDKTRSREVPLKVYFDKKSSDKQPVILFSHGLGGSREYGNYLGTHWAKAGYMAVFMQHPGSDESLWKDVPIKERMKALQGGASPKTFSDRMGDVPFVIDLLEKWNVEAEHPLKGRMDLDHIGMSGHSYGAVTTQAVMGQKIGNKEPYKDSRLDAFILMSPSPPGIGTPESAYGHIEAPIFCMTGTQDTTAIKTRAHVTPETRQTIYPALKEGGKYHLVFKDGQHHIFSDSTRLGKGRDPRYHPAILKFSTTFWDAYLKGDEKAKEWLQSDKPRDLLIKEDVYQWK